MPRRFARSDTHSSSTERAWRMRVRVGSPSREKVSARETAMSAGTSWRRTRAATFERLFICADDTMPEQEHGTAYLFPRRPVGFISRDDTPRSIFSEKDAILVSSTHG